MFQLLTYLIGIVVIVINTSYGQVDPQLCPNEPQPPSRDPRWQPVPSRFEIITEMIADNEITELSQAFSSTRDAVLLSLRLKPYQFYYNFQTNEVFEVLQSAGNQTTTFCLRQPITTASQTSVVLPGTLYVKPSVLLGYDERNQNNSMWGITYQNDGELRGIPTNVFRSCFFLNDIQATVLVTYHASDPAKFVAYLPVNESIILQMNVTVRARSGKQDTYTYNVFRYSPNPRQREERQALETPSGVYCPNRTSTLDVPTNIPERVSSNGELFVPNMNSSAIFSTHNLYDTEFQYVRFDGWFPDPAGRPFGFHFTEIHDYAVGLSYRYNNARHQCTVSDINPNWNDAVVVDDNPSLLQMGSPQHLFLMDDISYQYTGEKRCRDRVWCHVWIGEKTMPNNSVQHREWYWSSTFNNRPVIQSTPVKLIIKQYNNGVANGSYEINVFNYRRRPMTIFEIDYTLAECYRALGPAENYNLAVLSFRIINNKKYPVYENLNYLRLHIWETLIFTMFVRPTRISHLIVDQENDESSDIIVTFTLLDAPPRTGPVQEPLTESSLDSLVERLTSVIDSNGLAFRARYGTKQVTLRARGGSLNVPHRSTQQVVKTTGPTITGLWIGLILVGLLIGAVGGFFLFDKFAKKQTSV